MLRSLRLMTKNNTFSFEDIHWIQLKGTPPVPIYAAVFYGVFELFLLKIFGNNLLMYRLFIDDILSLCRRYDE